MTAERNRLVKEIGDLVSFEVAQLARKSILTGAPPSEDDVERIQKRVEQLCVDAMRIDDPAFGLPNRVVRVLLCGRIRGGTKDVPILIVRDLVRTDARTLRGYIGFGTSALARVRKSLARYRRALRGETPPVCSGGACSFGGR